MFEIDTKIKTLLTSQFIAALKGNGDDWQQCAAYMYTIIGQHKEEGKELNNHVSACFKKYLEEQNISECLKLYLAWPLQEFFPQLVTYVRKKTPDAPTLFSINNRMPPLLQIDILMEAGKLDSALNLTQNRLAFDSVNTLALELRQALLTEIMGNEDAQNLWDELATHTNSLEGALAGIFTGETDIDNLRLSYKTTESTYLIDFYASIAQLREGNLDIARILLQRSLINNQTQQWPYQLSRTLLETTLLEDM